MFTPTQTIRRIYWKYYSAYQRGRGGSRLSQTHLKVSGIGVLCGVRVPDWDAVEEDEGCSQTCPKCAKRAREMGLK